jgi:hypothetical protein
MRLLFFFTQSHRKEKNESEIKKLTKNALKCKQKNVWQQQTIACLVLAKRSECMHPTTSKKKKKKF